MKIKMLLILLLTSSLSTALFAQQSMLAYQKITPPKKMGFLAAITPQGVMAYVCESVPNSQVPTKVTRASLLSENGGEALAIDPFRPRRLVVAEREKLVLYDMLARREIKTIPYFEGVFEKAFNEAAETDLSDHKRRRAEERFYIYDIDWIDKGKLLIKAHWTLSNSFHAFFVYDLVTNKVLWYEQYDRLVEVQDTKIPYELPDGKKAHELSFKKNTLLIDGQQFDTIKEAVGRGKKDKVAKLEKVDFKKIL